MIESKPKFTPGPWRVVEAPGFTTNRRLIRTADGENIAATCFSDPADTLANATLIAAAPEMYEMLERLVPVVERFNSAVPLSPYAALDCAAEIRALLAKARGEGK